MSQVIGDHCVRMNSCLLFFGTQVVAHWLRNLLPLTADTEPQRPALDGLNYPAVPGRLHGLQRAVCCAEPGVQHQASPRVIQVAHRLPSNEASRHLAGRPADSHLSGSGSLLVGLDHRLDQRHWRVWRAVQTN